jgi:hypothetical protein
MGSDTSYRNMIRRILKRTWRRFCLVQEYYSLSAHCKLRACRIVVNALQNKDRLWDLRNRCSRERDSGRNGSSKWRASCHLGRLGKLTSFSRQSSRSWPCSRHDQLIRAFAVRRVHEIAEWLSRHKEAGLFQIRFFRENKIHEF